MLTTTNPLLAKVRETIPAATNEQIDDILNTIGSTHEAVMSKPGKLCSFLRLVEAAQPGGLAAIEPEAAIVSATAAPAKTVETPIVPANDGDRDWVTFNVRDLAALTTAELREFKLWRAEESERKALMNEILGEEASAIAAEEKALQNQLTIAETNRRVIKAKAQVEFLNEKGSALDELSLETGKDLAQDYFDRETESFATLRTVGKETPTEGELLLLQARVVNRDRMNRANTIANTIAPLVKAIGASTTAQEEVQTIDV